MLISGNQRRSRPAELSNATIKVKHTAKYFARLDILLSVSNAGEPRLIVTLAPSWVPTIAAAGAVAIVFDSVEVDAQALGTVVCLGSAVASMITWIHTLSSVWKQPPELFWSKR